jgi:adenylosuccinate lyase
MRAFRGEGSFLAFLKGDPEVKAALSDEELAALFALKQHIRHVDMIFERVFGDTSGK